MRRLLLALAGLAATTLPAAAQQAVRCPDTIEVAGTPNVPAGFEGGAGRSTHRFLQASFFEGAHDDRSAALAPDSDRLRGATAYQVFTFRNPRTYPVYVVCSYRDTTATLIADIPAAVTRCSLTFAYNQRTGAVGTPQRPQRMECR